MKRNTVLGIAVALLLAGGGVAFGMWLKKPTLDDLAIENRRLAQLDTVRTIELENNRVSYARLVFDFTEAREARAFVEDSLNGVVTDLMKKARDDKRTIETLVTANAQLRDSIDTMVGNISVTNDAITAELFTYKKYQDGSIQSDGYVTIYTPEDDEPYGNASLTFDIQMTPTVLISRDNEGLAECDLSFGDMPVYVSKLNCVNNWDVDLPVRKEINWPTVGVTAGAVGLIAVLLAITL
jgi:hypothetical protein